METVKLKGILTKSIVFAIVTLVTLIYFLVNVGPFLVGWTGLFLSIILGFVYYFIYKALSKPDLSDGAGWGLGILGSFLIGALAGNSLWVITIYASALFAVNLELVFQALALALIATIVIAVGGIAALPLLQKKSFKGGSKVFAIIAMMLFGYSIISFIAFFFALIGLPGLWTLIVQLTFGNGILAILFSLIAVIFAGFLYLKTIAIIADAIDIAHKNKEYFLSLLLINAIINLFIELFRLFLKLLSLFSKN